MPYHSNNYSMIGGEFYKQMIQINEVLNNIDDKSLVLIDELGSTTENSTAISIIWAILEMILTTSSYTIIATHYHELSFLNVLYPNLCKNINFAVDTNNNNIKYLYQLKNGIMDKSISNYGIYK